jgi:hypothetical protein
LEESTVRTKWWITLLMASLIGVFAAAVPGDALASGASSPVRHWMPTKVTTSTKAVPCTQPNDVCNIVTISTDSGHWVFSPITAKTTSGASIASSCIGWYYTQWTQENYGTNLFGVRVWDDKITYYWGYDYCSAYLSTYRHSAWTNVGYWTCGGVQVASPWWTGNDLNDYEFQGFGDVAVLCGDTWGWFNENYGWVSVYGQVGGYSNVGQ